MADDPGTDASPDTDIRTSTEIGIVLDFLDARERLDIDRAVELLAPDVVYRNVPFPPARGVAAVEKQLRGLERYCTGFEAQNHHVASTGNVVLTDRTDVIQVGRVRTAFWVAGTFEVTDGLITSWTDRFDMVDITWATLRGLAAAVIGKR
ncbi:limonene-1,2-epoxide hydrolase family protein [soil metagenome]